MRLIWIAASVVWLAACGDDKQAGGKNAVLSLPVNKAVVVVNGEQVDSALVEAYAKERGLDFTDPSQKAAAIRKVAEFVALAQAAKLLGFHNKPESALTQLKSQAAGFVQSKAEAAPITDADLKAEYDAQLTLVAGREFNVSILTLNSLDRTQTAARELSGGRPFDVLMGNYANTEGVVKAETLTWANLTQFPPKLAEAISKLKAGEHTSEAVPDNGLWHLVRINEERPFIAPDFEALKEGIRRTLREKRAQAEIEAVLAAAKISEP
jgi:peptidyl-prolyl cis-trans isomerase C